jgi:sulfatase maturation enzyme AslB (radical SAM superfamily)
VGNLLQRDIYPYKGNSGAREANMAVKASREFQIFAKPVGAICNLDCHYCYYLQKELLYPQTQSFRMPEDLLEEYIVQQIAIAPEAVINFFWHGGEPTILGSRPMVYFSMTTGAAFLQRNILRSGLASMVRKHCTTPTV